MEISEILAGIFPQLGPTALQGLSEAARMIDYPDQTVLCEEGAPGEIFYVLADGKVHILKNTVHGVRLVDTMYAVSCFGEMALLMNQPRGATVQADGDVTVIEIDRLAFDLYIRTSAATLELMDRQIIRYLLNQQDKILSQETEPVSKTQGPTQVFLSYAHEDQEFVSKLTSDLTEAGIAVWLDERNINIGNNWDAEVESALDSCQVMLLILSHSSVESRHVADEWHYFLDEGKPVIPALYEPCRIPYQLRRIQHVSFVDEEYAATFQRLVEQLRAHI